MKCTHPELIYCHHRHNGMCLADKIERCKKSGVKQKWPFG